MPSQITIALLLYNAENFIEDSLQSILNSGQEYDVLILDDASSDATHELVNRFLARLSYPDRSRFKLYVNEENVGTVKQLMRAANLCNTKYLKPADCADPFLSFDFSQIINEFETSGADVVFTRPMFINDEEIFENQSITKMSKNVISLSPKYRLWSLYSANNLVAPSAFFRRDFVKKIIPHIQKVKLLDDWPLWLYASFLNSKFVYVDNSFVAYRIHQAQKNKSPKIIEIFDNDKIEIENIKNRIIPFGGNYIGRKFFQLSSRILNRILCRV